MARQKLWLLAVTWFALLTPLGTAHAQLITSEDPKGIATLLEARGQTVILTVDEFGDPFIETSVNNIDYNVIFYGCVEHQACASIAFRAQRISPGQLTLSDVNSWNLQQRWTKVYSDDANSFILELDLFLAGGGITQETFSSYLDRWDASLVQFRRLVDDNSFDFVE